MESILVSVREPSSTGHGQHGVVALHPDAEELDRLRSQITGPSVGQIARHGVCSGKEDQCL